MPGRIRRQERLEELEEAVRRLREAAAGNMVVVEGPRDMDALEALGVGGQHIRVNQGIPLEALVDRVAQQHDGRQVILLPDWDRTGGRLFRRLRDGLEARVPLETECRRRLAKWSHEKCVEHLPSELAALRAKVHPPRGG